MTLYIQININQTVMQKKNLTTLTEISTPKSISRNTRTLSQNSGSGSSRGKFMRVQMDPIDKQNQSQNIQTRLKMQKGNQSINYLKGLRRIKQKVVGGENKEVVSQKQLKKQHDANIPQRSTKKTNNESKQSLLTNKPLKTPTNQSQKKPNPTKSQKSTPKSIPKKIVRQSKIQHQKTKSELSNQTVMTQTLINELQQTINVSNQEQKRMGTPLSFKQQEIGVMGISADYHKTPKKKTMMVSMFRIQKKLAESAFSTTFQVVHTQTGFIFCLKVFEKRKVKQQGLQQQILSEIKFRMLHNNAGMQKLFAVFDDEVYIYFVQEFLLGYGTIQKQLQMRRRLGQKQSGVIFRQVLETVMSIHRQNYIHRDIRLQNLVRCFGVIKIVDFSWVACLRYRKQRDTFCGTYKSAPPELLEGQNYDESIDIWSLGILLYELSTGQLPFSECSMKRGSHSMNFPIFLSNQLVDLIGRLLSPKGTRMKIQQITMHEWSNKWELDGFVAKQIWDFWVLI